MDASSEGLGVEASSDAFSDGEGVKSSPEGSVVSSADSEVKMSTAVERFSVNVELISFVLAGTSFIREVVYGLGVEYIISVVLLSGLSTVPSLKLSSNFSALSASTSSSRLLGGNVGGLDSSMLRPVV